MLLAGREEREFAGKRCRRWLSPSYICDKGFASRDCPVQRGIRRHKGRRRGHGAMVNRSIDTPQRHLSLRPAPRIRQEPLTSNIISRSPLNYGAVPGGDELPLSRPKDESMIRRSVDSRQTPVTRLPGRRGIVDDKRFHGGRRRRTMSTTVVPGAPDGDTLIDETGGFAMSHVLYSC